MTLVWIAVGFGLLMILFRIFGAGSPTNPSMPANVTDEDIRKLALQGQKIEAIKWYRALHSVGLKEAKDAVEKMK